MPKKTLKIVLVLIVIAAIVAFFVLDLKQYATLDYLKQQQHILTEYYTHNTVEVVVVFAVAYIVVTALSIPMAAVLTLTAGALFGFALGLIVTSFASTMGATLSFWLARFLAHDYVQKKYAKVLLKVNAGFEREGAFYLFALRLAPLFPFFMVNILMALMPIKTWTFYWVSQLGMLSATALFVYAGTQLAQVTSLSDIVSPSLLLAFALLGLFPLVTKKIIETARKEKKHDSI